MRRKKVVLDDHRVVDGVQAPVTQAVEGGIARVGNERLHVGRVDLDPDRRDNLSRQQQILDLLAGLDRHDVGRRLVLGDVLVA